MTRALPIAAEPGSALPALRDRLATTPFTTEGVLYRAEAAERLRCLACAHRCVLADGAFGACGVRQNRGGTLRVPHGYVARRYVRTVETNTIFHVLPGAKALTFGMYGCDLRCPYCHNHQLSQALRDDARSENPIAIEAAALADEAIAGGCQVLCAAYNEPLIASEWVREVFSAARARGLRTALVTDGHSTPEALRYLRDVTDVLRVDLKADSEQAYKRLGGRLQPVLDSIELGRQLGYWVEVVTLVVPGLNQERRAILRLGAYLRELSAELPWHLNGFVPRYKQAKDPPASPTFLMTMAGAAYVAGSRFVYVGNVPECAGLAHTRCPECHVVVVQRADYTVRSLGVDGGKCQNCGQLISGIWS